MEEEVEGGARLKDCSALSVSLISGKRSKKPLHFTIESVFPTRYNHA